jgi:hypothetical protein
MRTSAAILAAALLVAFPGEAHGYTINSVLGAGCHETITSQALRAVRLDLATAAPLPATSNEQALVDDVQFTPDGDMKDLGAATLLVAVRDNDLKGRGSSDLSQLAEVHGDPNAQQEHCLRGPNQKEPGGSEAAVAACRKFIRARVLEALDGLDAKGKPDLTKRTTLTVHLSMRGQVDAPLPTYYVRIGQAMHAVQDSFTHTYRTADELKITVVLDWLDFINGKIDESVDGPAHATLLDHCDDADGLLKRKRELATEASVALLRATLDPTKTHDQKVASLDAMLDKYLSYSPGCTFKNNWCNAPENQYKDSAGCGCRVGKTDASLGAVVSGILLGLAAAARRARRRKTMAITAGTLVSSIAILLVPTTARADDEAPAPAPTSTNGRAAYEEPAPTNERPAYEAPAPAPPPTNEHAPPPPTVVPVKEPGPKDPTKTAWGAYAAVSGSIEKAAVAGTVGGRMRLSKHWTFGIDGEWNPWLALNGTPIRRGVINAYGTIILRFPLAYEKFNLRTSVNLGTSYLLSNFYGAPSGSTGVYLGTSPLSLEWKLSRAFYLIINPLNFALPVPQLKGVPLLYPQYRSTIGIEVYAG